MYTKNYAKKIPKRNKNKITTKKTTKKNKTQYSNTTTKIPNIHKNITKASPTNKDLHTNTKKNTKKHLENTHKPRQPKRNNKPKHYKIIILLSGDIETNPGPMPNILKRHPTSHKKNAKIYFIPNTIRLQPEYRHIAQTFAPLLKTTHILHQIHNTTHPNIAQYIQQQNTHPPTHILYALVITTHPNIDKCNQLLNPQSQNIITWTNTLLQTLSNLQNPPKSHIHTLHPYTKFLEENESIINHGNSIHKELYDFLYTVKPYLPQATQ
jgi:outer membrane protein OmpA-like peptidoglycan-associated protein